MILLLSLLFSRSYILCFYASIVPQCRFNSGILVVGPRVHFALSLDQRYTLFLSKAISSEVFVVPRVNNAEVLCLGLVSVTVFMLVMPLFKATGGILLQMAPPSIPSSALSKCFRQVILFVSASLFSYHLR